MDSNKRQEWRTPPELFEKLNEEFAFGVDAAANKDNHLCEIWFGPGSKFNEDGLSADWQLPTFCNPGFSNMKLWIDKAYNEFMMWGSDIAVIGLCAPSTAWWNEIYDKCSQIRLLSPRPQFLPPANSDILKSSNPRECAVFIFSNLVKSCPFNPFVQWKWKN